MALSVIVPANNEEAYIGACLEAVLQSDWPAEPGGLEVIVVANGCSDKTADVSQGYAPRFAERGWPYRVLDLAEGGKMNALNAGDAAARHAARAYLDADVLLSPPLLSVVNDALDTAEPRYASGTPVVRAAQSWATRAYRRIYVQVPFMTHGVPGFGIFAVNAAGRSRWGEFPDIISDDTFVRLTFSPEERIAVRATHDWPMVEGFGRLVKVRRRQDRGVAEIAEKYPELLANDDKIGLGLAGMLRLALRDPTGFAVYAAVALAVKLTKSRAKSTWTRGR
ncbi:MAG: glycosyltransferase [Pseudomonadota bacterium]